MENGPFRMGGQPAGNRAAQAGHNAPERAAAVDKITLLDEPDERPEPVRRETPRHHEPKRRKPEVSKKFLIIIGAVVAVVLAIIVLAGGWLVSRSETGAAIDGGRYQAVFFTNGQVYFGKLKPLNASYMKLTDIFYLQAKSQDASVDSKNPQITTPEQGDDVQLIKLGNEIHGPDDEMIISRDQILFFENLKKDGKVSDTISKYHAK